MDSVAIGTTCARGNGHYYHPVGCIGRGQPEENHGEIVMEDSTTHPGDAIVSPSDVDWSTAEAGGQRVSLSSRLGCSDTSVEVYRTRADAYVSLPTRLEQLCVPIDGPGTLSADGTHPVSEDALGFVSAGTAATIASETDATWLVVSAPADQSPGWSPVVVDAGDLAFEVPTTSDILTARLTDRLGCRGMKVNVRRLKPGDVVPYHTEGTQEELFVPIDGDGIVRVDGAAHAVSRGSVTRVAPEHPRSAVNRGQEDVLWLMVGAPPTGGADEWDPGAEIHEWPHPD